MVEKWLVMVLSQSVRVKRASRASSNQRRYVCREALQLADSFAIYLFRQGGGTWDVFPPDAERPAMSMLMCGAIGIFAHVTDRRSRL